MGPLFTLLFGLLFALPSALVFFGGIRSLAVAVDKHAAKKAPLSFAAFFAGLGYWAVLLVSGVLFGSLLMKGYEFAVVVVFLLAAFGGGLGGGVYGYRLGVARRRRYSHLNT